MKRGPLVALIALIALAMVTACTHDWSLPLATAEDGGADAGAGATQPEAAASLCAGARFCDSFDGPDLRAVWDGVLVTGEGVIRTEGLATARSAPNALLVERRRDTGPPYATYVTKVLQGTMTSARLELDILPETLDPDGAVVAAGVVFEDGTASEHKIRLNLRARDAALHELGATEVINVHALPKAPPLGTWSHVAIAVMVGGAIVVEELARELHARAGITELVASEHDILDGIARSLM